MIYLVNDWSVGIRLFPKIEHWPCTILVYSVYDQLRRRISVSFSSWALECLPSRWEHPHKLSLTWGYQIVNSIKKTSVSQTLTISYFLEPLHAPAKTCGVIFLTTSHYQAGPLHWVLCSFCLACKTGDLKGFAATERE